MTIKKINKKNREKRKKEEEEEQDWIETKVAEIEVAVNIKYINKDGDETVVAGPVIKMPIKVKGPAA